MERNNPQNQPQGANQDMEQAIEEIIQGRPRQFEKLPPAFMEQFSSKSDLYDFMKGHLQVSSSGCFLT